LDRRADRNEFRKIAAAVESGRLAPPEQVGGSDDPVVWQSQSSGSQLAQTLELAILLVLARRRQRRQLVRVGSVFDERSQHRRSRRVTLGSTPIEHSQQLGGQAQVDVSVENDGSGHPGAFCRRADAKSSKRLRVVREVEKRSISRSR
jgi:hypothetical protein